MADKAKIIIVEQAGDVNVMNMREVPLKPLKDGEVLIEHSAIGINHSDIHYRRGDFQAKFPLIPGWEACGYVVEVGPNAGNLEVGARVAYATAPMGAYCNKRVIHSKYLLAVPDNIKDEQVSSFLFKGLTAHYLMRRTFFVHSGITVLIHGASGGVGMLLTQFAKFVGAKVIATASTDKKCEIAKSNGADYCINYSKDNFVEAVRDITKGMGVNVLYDSVGKDVFKSSIDALMPFGLYVSYGQTSGHIPKIDTDLLQAKCLFLTCPSLFGYKSYKIELVISAIEIFEMLTKGVFRSNATNKFKFNEEDIRKSHLMIESRESIGSSVIIL